MKNNVKDLLMISIVSIFLLLVSIIITPFIEALDLSDIRNQVRIFLKDTSSDTDRQRWSDTQINNAINIAQNNVNCLTWCTHSSYSISVTTGTREYDLGSDVYGVERVTLDDKIIPMLSIKKLDKGDEDWEGSTTDGTPTNYYIRQNLTSSETNYVIGFDPLPDDDFTAKIFYITIPDDMSADSDEPFNDYARLVPYHHLVVLYTVYWLQFADGNLNEATLAWKQYQAEIAHMGKYIKWPVNYQEGVSGSRR
jgi:hypothetical protein